MKLSGPGPYANLPEALGIDCDDDDLGRRVPLDQTEASVRDNALPSLEAIEKVQAAYDNQGGEAGWRKH